ncbi:MAG TPA: (2Fe-2S)-binding protein [Woeseiaceae bacterium]|nr:(2Fe-2S)-binding protein [Woeseiaceae bacterium]
MYVCICRAVTDKEIRRAKSEGLGTLDDLRDVLGVATGCGSCTATVESILGEPDARPECAGPRLYVPSAA